MNQHSQEATPEDLIRARRRKRVEGLYPSEQGWRLSPGDGCDPADVSDIAMHRELTIEAQLREQLRDISFPDAETRAAAEERLRDELKHFPVLFVSAPHIEDAISGTFPGVPTPLLFATALLDRHLRIDEFPAQRVPRVVAVMNPPLYTPEFVDELRDKLRRHRPRLVGISNLSESHYYALEIARIVREAVPEAVVVFGGQHENGTNPLAYRSAVQRRGRGKQQTWYLTEAELARIDDMQTLAHPDERALIDFVAAGDGPHPLFELVKLLAADPEMSAAQLKSTVLAHDGTFAALPGSGQLFCHDPADGVLRSVSLSGAAIDGDRMPFISVVELTHENRFPVFANKKTAQVMACNGCKYSCAFCHESAEHFLYGVPKLLQRSAPNVIQELELRREQGHEAVFFDDSTFTQNRHWLSEILDLMLERADGYSFLEWGCQTTINDVTEDMLLRMAQVGCTYIYFGIESAQPEVTSVQKVRQLRILGDGDNWANRFSQVAKWCHGAGIRVGTSLQFGLDETPEQREGTLQLVAELYASGYIAPGCVSLNINAPYPGTLQWVEALRDADQPLPEYRQRLIRHPAFETAHQFTRLPRETIDDIYRSAAEMLGEAILSVDFAAYEQWRRDINSIRGDA